MHVKYIKDMFVIAVFSVFISLFVSCLDINSVRSRNSNLQWDSSQSV